jgi:polysaccharide biosynthesis transport protein
MYRASADVLVRLPPTATAVGTTGSVMSPRQIENEFQTASGSTLQTQVRGIIGGEPTLSVSSSDDSDVFRFTATSSDAPRPLFAANTYAEQYIEVQTTSLIDEYGARTAVLEDQLVAIEAGRRRPGPTLRVPTRTRESRRLDPTGPYLRRRADRRRHTAGRPVRTELDAHVTLALVVGLLLGLGAAFLVDYLDTSLKHEDDLVQASGLPNLAVVPQLKDWKSGTAHVITREDPHSPAAEAYRSLRTGVRFMALDRPLKLVLLTSPRPGDGKTTTATNLAVAAARAGQRVLLVDCDLRKPQVHSFFGLDNDRGFTTVLLGETTMPKVAQRVPGESNLLVITSGPLPPDPSELLAGDSARRVLGAIGDDSCSRRPAPHGLGQEFEPLWPWSSTASVRLAPCGRWSRVRRTQAPAVRRGSRCAATTRRGPGPV